MHELRVELRKVADEFLKLIRDTVNSWVLIGDEKSLRGLIALVKIYLDHRVIETLRDKGFLKELEELCEKAGVERAGNE
ncbi:hypothetical protein DRO64_05940 [Candidatus Bathyarchaeota archaeon]|nr:MAG: hypothetical protein DRO64_05940 [Candidatus Bathyarchaeota archaeon]